MSTFKQKKELKAQIAAAKKAGKSVQTIGKLQYKLNNLASDPKGNAVRTKSGSAVKTGTGGTVRSKVNPNRTTGRSRSTVTVTPLGGKSRKVAAGSGKVIKANQSRLHPYTKLTDAQLKTKVKAGDKRAKAILDIRTGK
tara:strand:- start:196 stop:612 length:417 start_codon:yes stop_codon:yes gene_type:complete